MLVLLAEAWCVSRGFLRSNPLAADPAAAKERLAARRKAKCEDARAQLRRATSRPEDGGTDRGIGLAACPR